jgi:opacity protein-like surface antigen
MRRAASLCLVLLGAATPAHAEWFVDLYAGAAYTPRSDLVLVVGSPGGPADHTFHDVKWDKSTLYGGRAGYWLEAAPWYGIGLDVFRYRADVPTQTVETTISGVTAPATLQAIDFSVAAIAFDVVRLRYPLRAGAEGLEPYVTAGPALFKVRVTNRANGELTTRPASDSVMGYKLAAGVSWQIVKGGAVFGEYRYTHFRAEPVLQGTITGAGVPMRFDLDTHHLAAGVSFSF